MGMPQFPSDDSGRGPFNAVTLAVLYRCASVLQMEPAVLFFLFCLLCLLPSSLPTELNLPYLPYLIGVIHPQDRTHSTPDFRPFPFRLSRSIPGHICNQHTAAATYLTQRLGKRECLEVAFESFLPDFFPPPF